MLDAALDEHEGADEAAMWVCRFAAGEPGGWGRHRHRQHQIAWVSRGVSTVVLGGRGWIVTPSRAVWIPGDVPHDIVNRDGAILHCLYVWPDSCPLDWPEPAEVAMTPLARELLLSVGEPGVETPVSAAIATVLFAELERGAPVAPTLPMPAEGPAADLARAILDHPGGQQTLEQWARRLATSASTLRRAFLNETGMTFSEWRTRARLDAARSLLADGLGVGRVARSVGYASRSGFVDAFRRHVGHPPTAYRPGASASVEAAR
jgi:AraC-like DNA-binding protein